MSRFGVDRGRACAGATKSPGFPPCEGILRKDFNALIQSGADPTLTVGQRVTSQWRQRDPLDPAGFGDALSDAIQFWITP